MVRRAGIPAELGRYRYCHASPSVCTLCQARLATSLPMPPGNSARAPRRTRRVLVPERSAPAIGASPIWSAACRSGWSGCATPTSAPPPRPDARAGPIA